MTTLIKSSHLAALYTFVEVGKHTSLTAAAKQLCLTTGAVSQQLLQLEQQLGFSLFERHSRGIRFTDKGRQLHQCASVHLGEIEAEVGRLRQEQGRAQEVRLKLTPSFAFKWLVPKLDSFHQQYPEIQIQIFAEGALVNSDTRDFDLAIDYRPHPYRHPNAELLLDESLLPVMSGKYLHAHPWLSKASYTQQEWASVVLLHDAMPWEKAARDFEWLSWVAERRLDLPTDRGHFFNRTDMAMSAAEAGVGIAMARMALIDNELESGRLVSPFQPIKANAGYYLIRNSENDSTAAFIAWLKRQINN
ncbi:LysR family transcriptional regulator [Vibrio navarrensis]|jgi:DNA-binding transcriptional LysR family regulator|uniref:LysR substrate-binding domain-containing protein n=1 Tax=Vibrio navarrensis TaxID=29495 RepID=UPI00057EDC18|nr:LysR substrate-binding domain-containing protein [Vibrio navarrensis]EJK2115494.1 LysR family transcriptional regulator [Vibrio navarrensis]MBE3666975.1 LysR family transcriptional regulator [Vibrio navarrensis]MBE4576825.1 LysR family transcriptional regulator [Vibrio navarrensis]MBE4580284.1 LysR family transcriptional regulator [Vibrio navarrensis]MBE4585318.1 LysR family transcriptional regulator [Vibrio navarrensis]